MRNELCPRRARVNETFHPIAWLLWLTAAALPAMLTRNPLYLLLLLLATAASYGVLQRRTPQGQAWGVFLRAGLFLVALSLPLNALVVHAGNLVLLRLPAAWPVVGGNITLEAVLYGLSSGLNLLSLLLIFATFNLGLDQSRLLRLIPKPFYTVGVVAAIAVTFVPQMLISLQEIREVQRLRGFRARGLRDAGPLLLPLLTTGLERAIQLAESMEARGFSRVQMADAPRRALTLRLALILALGLLLIGLFARSYWPSARGWAPLLTAAGLLLLACLFWWQGRQIQRTRYRRWVWRRRDTWLGLACFVVLSVTSALWLTNRVALLYYPYPPYSPWPSFQPLLGAALALLIAPALLIPARRRAEGAGEATEG